MKINIERGKVAQSRIADGRFLAEWGRVCEQCPWATVFQGPRFGSIWYESYRTQFEPLLVFSRSKNGKLAGLMSLAVSSKNGQLVVIGDRQAEYQSWICPPELGDTFPLQALRALKGSFSGRPLRFKYLPAGTPVGWIKDNAASRICGLESHRRPLMRFAGGEEITKTLNKKSNKSRLRRLEKSGPPELIRLTDLPDFEQVFNTIVDWYDIRQGAAYGKTPFRDDDSKGPFHLALIKSPGLVHATVLKFGRQIVAAHIGGCGHREVHLGIVAHNPVFAKHSPGKFLLLFLARMLIAEEYKQLDLTPGDDPYKNRFATDYDEVQTLTVFTSRNKKFRENAQYRAAELVNTGLKAIRIEPQQIRTLSQKIKRVDPVKSISSRLRNAFAWTSCRREMRVYSCHASRVPEPYVQTYFRRDSINDMLLFQPVEAWQSRQEFLSFTLSRLELGDHIYTFAENAKLLHYGWLAERKDKAFVSEVRTEFTFPPDSACLARFYTFPDARGRGLYQGSLQTMLQDAARVPGTEKIFISVLADNGPSRHVIEKVGFEYETSLLEEVRLGRVRRWVERIESGPTTTSSH